MAVEVNRAISPRGSKLALIDFMENWVYFAFSLKLTMISPVLHGESAAPLTQKALKATIQQ